MRSNQPSNGSPPRDEQPLDSWKEIASYLGRSVRTAQSWETNEGLPVRRHQHLKAGTVYAYPSEIDAWRAAREAPGNVGKGTGRLLPGRTWLPWVVLALLVVAVVSWLAQERTSADPEVAAGQSRDWLLIANFDNLTGDEVPDGTLEAALRRELAGFVKLAPEERLRDSLRLLQRPDDTPVDAALAREMAHRDPGIRGVLIGRAEREAASFRLTVDLLDPGRGTPVASLSEVVEEPEALLPAIAGLSLRIRESLGESVSPAEPPRPGPSFDVLRRITLADRRLREGAARADRTAEQLLRDALSEDSDFGPALTLLAWARARLDAPPAEFLDLADRALERLDSATPAERYFSLGSRHHMHWMVSRGKDDLDAAIAQYQALLELDPGHFWARFNLGGLLSQAGLGREALAHGLRSLEARPHDQEVLSQIALALVTGEGDLDQARVYVERARRLQQELGAPASHSVALLEFFHPHELWVRGDVEGAVAEVDRIVESLVPGTPDEQANLRYLAGEALAFYLGLGMYGRAEELQRSYAIYPDSRWESLLAWRRADRERVAAQRRELRSTANPVRLADSAWDLALLGFVDEAESWLAELPEDLPQEARADVLAARGTAALAAGRIREAVANLEGSVALRSGVNGERFRATRALARALGAAGEPERGIQLLEQLSSLKRRMLFGRNYWLEARLELAVLYRQVGRQTEAAAIEQELRRACAWAEPDYPVLRELNELDRPRA